MNFAKTFYITEDTASQKRAAYNILHKARFDKLSLESAMNLIESITAKHSGNRAAKNNAHLPDLAKLIVDMWKTAERFENLAFWYDKYMSEPKLYTKPLSRFQGKFLKFTEEIDRVTAKVGTESGSDIDPKEAVYEDEHVLVFFGKDMDSCIKYGKGDKWGLCICRTNKEENFFTHYRYDDSNKGYSTYFVYFKNPKVNPPANFILLERTGNNDYSMNLVANRNGIINEDNIISEQQILNRFPILKGLLDSGTIEFVSYDDKEKRYLKLLRFRGYTPAEWDELDDEELKTYFNRRYSSSTTDWNVIARSRNVENIIKVYVNQTDIKELMHSAYFNAMNHPWYPKFLQLLENYNLYDKLVDRLVPGIKKEVESFVAPAQQVKRFPGFGIIGMDAMKKDKNTLDLWCSLFYDVIEDFSRLGFGYMGSEASVSIFNRYIPELFMSRIGDWDLSKFPQKFIDAMYLLLNGHKTLATKSKIILEMVLLGNSKKLSPVHKDLIQKLANKIYAHDQNFIRMLNRMYLCYNYYESEEDKKFMENVMLDVYDSLPPEAFQNSRDDSSILHDDTESFLIRGSRKRKEEKVNKESFDYFFEAKRLMPLSKTIIRPISHEMEKIESEHFPWPYKQDADDIYDDSLQPGFVGMGVFEDDDIKGYIYGYGLSEDEIHDAHSALENNEPVMNSFRYDAEELMDTINSSNCLYVSNFVVVSEYRKSVHALLSGFFEEVRKKGYKFMAFDGLSDTAKLIIDTNSGKVKVHRLASANLELIAYIPVDNERKLFLVELY